MSSEDSATDMSAVRDEVDTVQGDIAEELSEMQSDPMGYTEDEEEVRPEQARYRVTMGDYGAMENENLYTQYFDNYTDAIVTFNQIADDTDFIKHYDRPSVKVRLEKSYRGLSQIFWETINESIVYDDGQ